MATSHEGADLVLKLYDLRREVTMREARSWYRLSFDPESPDEVIAVLEGPNSAFFRMVVSYWDMAAALVNHGVIDEALFNDVNVEHVGTFAMIEPFLADIRAGLGNPDWLAHLEQLVMRLPGAKTRLAAVRDQSRRKRAPLPDTAEAALPFAARSPSPETSEAQDPQAGR